MQKNNYDNDEIERDAPDIKPGGGPFSGEIKPMSVMIPVSKIWEWFKNRKEKE